MQRPDKKLAPSMPDESPLLCAAKRIAREVAGNGCTVSPGNRPEKFWVEGTRQLQGIPRMLVFIETQAAEDFQNATPSQQSVMIERLRGNLVCTWSDASEHAGIELHLHIDPETLQ